MANDEQLKILKQGVEVWNRWRDEHPEDAIDLSGIKLDRPSFPRINFSGVNLSQAYLRDADLKGVNLEGADLTDANLEQNKFLHGNLSHANFSNATLYKADFFRTVLKHADLRQTNLLAASLHKADAQGADLRGADLREATLVQTNLQGANLTGAKLYGTSRDDWNIDGVLCDYIYWDFHYTERTPNDRDFRPGEFEDLYKSLPTIEYYFEHGFTPVDAVLMDKVVQAVNDAHPDFELRLDSFHSRGQPHAVFTVLHQEQADPALQQIRQDYEARIQQLQGKEAALMQVIDMLSSRPRNIELVLGDKRMITTGRDYHEQTDGDTIITP